jgi:hypothetical protein
MNDRITIAVPGVSAAIAPLGAELSCRPEMPLAEPDLRV